MVSLNIQYKKQGFGFTNSFKVCRFTMSRRFFSQNKLKFTSKLNSSQFLSCWLRSAFCSAISRSRSLSFFFFSCNDLISLSIYSFIIWYRFYCCISNYSMIRLKDFSSLSISSLNFFLTFNSNLLYSSSLAGVSYSRVSTSVRSSQTIRFISTTKLLFRF